MTHYDNAYGSHVCDLLLTNFTHSRVLFHKLTLLHLVTKFPTNLWSLKVHYRVNNSPPHACNLDQMYPVHPPPLQSYTFKINFNIMLSSTSSSSKWSVAFSLPHDNSVCILFYPTRATWPTNHPYRRYLQSPVACLKMIRGLKYGEPPQYSVQLKHGLTGD